jgi:hypothetical protein
MRVFANARGRNLTVRVHPLLLSLTMAINESETNPDLSTISENDARILGNDFYTLPSAFPPLEIHISGQNGPSLTLHLNRLFSQIGSRLPRMYGSCSSRKLRGAGECHLWQFGSNA